MPNTVPNNNLRLKAGRILTVTGGKLLMGEETAEFRLVSTDSRSVLEGDLFVALKGEQFDGHEYVEMALGKGAKGAVISDEKVFDKIAEQYAELPCEQQPKVILVENTLTALGQIANGYRKRFDCKIVAVTGSVGKTSTKEIVASVLGDSMNVHKTDGNFNNEIGVPITLFQLRKEHEVAVVEMGMNHQGEIRRLSNIAQPDVAIITNIGDAHIGILGSKQNILKAKLEIVSGLSKEGTLIVNGDDDLLAGVVGMIEQKTMTYGLSEGVDVRATSVVRNAEDNLCFDVEYSGRVRAAVLHNPGIHNVSNALAAIAAGLVLGLPFEKLVDAVSTSDCFDKRMKMDTIGQYKLIDDTYNASPTAMHAALRMLGELNHDGRRVAVLGDMLELGEFAESLHMSVGKEAVQHGVDLIVAVGSFADAVKQGALEEGANERNIIVCADNDEAVLRLKNGMQAGDCILFKASHGSKINEVYSAIKEYIS